jgi:hypothetical protein
LIASEAAIFAVICFVKKDWLNFNCERVLMFCLQMGDFNEQEFVTKNKAFHMHYRTIVDYA